MRLGQIFNLFVVALLLSVVPTAFSQVTPAARENSLPLVVGAGASSYNVDWNHSRMEGGTLWVDWNFSRAPSFLHGIGIEAEARDISLGSSSSREKNFRLDTVGGGVIYTWHHFRNFRPYGKFLMSLGGIDWNNPNPKFKHETRTVTAPGLGLEFRAFRNVWVRADYEYQFWPDIAQWMPNSTHVLDPQGFTVGAMYNFSHHRHY